MNRLNIALTPNLILASFHAPVLTLRVNYKQQRIQHG